MYRPVGPHGQRPARSTTPAGYSQGPRERSRIIARCPTSVLRSPEVAPLFLALHYLNRLGRLCRRPADIMPRYLLLDGAPADPLLWLPMRRRVTRLRYCPAKFRTVLLLTTAFIAGIVVGPASDLIARRFVFAFGIGAAFAQDTDKTETSRLLALFGDVFELVRSQ